MVTPVARREAVAHVVGMFEASEGRARSSGRIKRRCAIARRAVGIIELLPPIVAATYLRSGGAWATFCGRTQPRGGVVSTRRDNAS